MTLIGTPRHALDAICVAFEHADAAPRYRIPQPQATVVVHGARNGVAAIGAHRQMICTETLADSLEMNPPEDCDPLETEYGRVYVCKVNTS